MFIRKFIGASAFAVFLLFPTATQAASGFQSFGDLGSFRAATQALYPGQQPARGASDVWVLDVRTAQHNGSASGTSQNPISVTGTNAKTGTSYVFTVNAGPRWRVANNMLCASYGGAATRQASITLTTPIPARGVYVDTVTLGSSMSNLRYSVTASTPASPYVNQIFYPQPTDSGFGVLAGNSRGVVNDVTIYADGLSEVCVGNVYFVKP